MSNVTRLLSRYRAPLYPDCRRPLSGPDAVAVEYIAWALTAGMSAADVAIAHGMPFPMQVTWKDIREWMRRQQAQRSAA